MFINEAMGKSVAIYPSKGKVYAPSNGEVVALFETGHAIGLKLDSGVEMLIHVGVDTINLKGKHFYKKVKNGQKVKKGKLLLEFDYQEIEKAGYNPIVVVAITNSNDYFDVMKTKETNVSLDTCLFGVIKE